MQCGQELRGFIPILTRKGAFAVGPKVKMMEGFRTECKQGRICISKGVFGQFPFPRPVVQHQGHFSQCFLRC